jgi:hypothetical protein
MQKSLGVKVFMSRNKMGKVHSGSEYLRVYHVNGFVIVFDIQSLQKILHRERFDKI